MSLALAARYARALTDLVFAPDSGADPDGIARELSLFVDQYEASAPLRDALATPAVAVAKKRAVVDKLSAQLGLSSVTKRFLFVVIDHGRMRSLKLMRDAYVALVDERRGVVKAEVVSAAPLAPEERLEIEKSLTRKAGRGVRCEFSVDPALLGGVLARIGSTVYDGSVRGRLGGMAARLTAQV
ncbi:MAG: ATP synthase F1 subunit delta [Bryobacteraceae bacterium]|nr:ATP synthase F1 subunit delta [Bryobacteraceae bacterium]